MQTEGFALLQIVSLASSLVNRLGYIEFFYSEHSKCFTQLPEFSHSHMHRLSMLFLSNAHTYTLILPWMHRRATRGLAQDIWHADWRRRGSKHYLPIDRWPALQSTAWATATPIAIYHGFDTGITIKLLLCHVGNIPASGKLLLWKRTTVWHFSHMQNKLALETISSLNSTLGYIFSHIWWCQRWNFHIKRTFDCKRNLYPELPFINPNHWRQHSNCLSATQMDEL